MKDDRSMANGNLTTVTTATSMERVHHGVWFPTVPEPLPDWSQAQQIWRHWWPIHVYSFGIIFFVCGIMSVIIAVRMIVARRAGLRRQRVGLGMALCVVCLCRSMYLLIDAYHSTTRLPVCVTQLINGFTYPSLIYAMTTFDRLLSALIHLPSLSMAPTTQHGHHPQRTVVSPTAVGALTTYFIVTAILYPIATLVTGARASILIAEAAFVTWGFALSFVAGGRCIELRRVGRLADDSRRRLVAYVRLKRHLANETESGRQVMRHQRQQLKILRRQLETSLMNGQRFAPNYAGKRVSVDMGNNYGEFLSSSSMSSLSFNNMDPLDVSQPSCMVDVTSVHALSMIPNGKPSASSVAKATKSTTKTINRPTDLPLWSATASIVSGGVTMTPAGYSPLPPRDGSTTIDNGIINSYSDDNDAGDDLRSKPNYSRVSAMIPSDKKHTKAASSNKLDDKKTTLQLQNTSVKRRYERFAIDCYNDKNHKQEFSTRPPFLSRFRFRSIGSNKDGAVSKTNEKRRYSELRRGWTTSDVDIDNNSDDCESRCVECSVSGWKSETTLLSRLSTSETMPSLTKSPPCGRMKKTTLILEAGSCDSGSSGDVNTAIGRRKNTEATGMLSRRLQLDAVGSPGYVADSEQESPATAAADDDDPTANDRQKNPSLIDNFFTKRSQFQTSAVGNDYQQLMTGAGANNSTVGVVAISSTSTAGSLIPQPMNHQHHGRRRRIRQAEVIALRRAFVVSCLTVVIELVLCSVQIYAMFGIYGVLSNIRTVVSPWSWLTFQTIARLVEVLFLTMSLVLVAVTSTDGTLCGRRNQTPARAQQQLRPVQSSHGCHHSKRTSSNTWTHRTSTKEASPWTTVTRQPSGVTAVT